MAIPVSLLIALLSCMRVLGMPTSITATPVSTMAEQELLISAMTENLLSMVTLLLTELWLVVPIFSTMGLPG